LLEKNNITNSVKIISGTLNRRSIVFNDSSKDLRPTLSRIKETLFNWLDNNFDDVACLDLFAGSGSLGFEAISRGAKNCTFVDNNIINIQNIEKNIKKFNLDNCYFENKDAKQYIKSAEKKFDLIFFDPPYKSKYYELLDEIVVKLLAFNGVIYIESSNKIQLENIKMIKCKKTKTLHYGIYQANG
jgi:16S rRNA (guanine966-N2)-methyltransferase